MLTLKFTDKFLHKSDKLLVIPVVDEFKPVPFLDKDTNALKKEFISKSRLFTGKYGEAGFYFDRAMGDVLIYHLGKRSELNSTKVQRAFSSVAQIAQGKKYKEVAVYADPVVACGYSTEITDGFVIGEYIFDKYLTKPELSRIDLLEIVSLKLDKRKRSYMETFFDITMSARLTRDLVNDVSYSVIPSHLRNVAEEVAKKGKLKTEILGRKELEKHKLGLILAVASGSSHEPFLFIARYDGDPKSKERTAVIGKGITFDTGGINLKPSGFLETMRDDMTGAATVIAIMENVIKYKPKKNIIFAFATCDNAIDSAAFRPGDVFTSYDGTTVEIGNTDCEGRLVLADAIGYVKKNYEPTHMMTFATLTGACLVAFGYEYAATMGNDQKTIDAVKKLGASVSEFTWQLPVHEDFRIKNKSEFADINNLPSDRFAGAIMGGMFLERFFGMDGKIKWTHFDIAGTAFFPKLMYGCRTGGTGWGVRLMTKYLANL